MTRIRKAPPDIAFGEDAPARELRCECGNLMARVTPAGVELKCRRCKRVVSLGMPPPNGLWVKVSAR